MPPHREGTKIEDYLDSTVCAIYSWVIPSMKTFSNVVLSISMALPVSAWYCLIAIGIVAVEIHMIIISRKETKNER